MSNDMYLTLSPVVLQDSHAKRVFSVIYDHSPHHAPQGCNMAMQHFDHTASSIISCHLRFGRAPGWQNPSILPAQVFGVPFDHTVTRGETCRFLTRLFKAWLVKGSWCKLILAQQVHKRRVGRALRALTEGHRRSPRAPERRHLGTLAKLAKGQGPLC